MSNSCDGKGAKRMPHALSEDRTRIRQFVSMGGEEQTFVAKSIDSASDRTSTACALCPVKTFKLPAVKRAKMTLKSACLSVVATSGSPLALAVVGSTADSGVNKLADTLRTAVEVAIVAFFVQLSWRSAAGPRPRERVHAVLTKAR